MAVDPFKRLGLQGLQPLAPVLLAALATEAPLLLIGPHGTAKSLLLTRVAEALGLEFRHYNASLLNFDDLVGFPLPGTDGTLQYVKTPVAIWGAGAVIFDEISRCRPDIQNKLFPIIHERRAQGLLLEGLRYRWAAMNPPPSEDAQNGYLGSEPLDTALADRFAYVVEMPGWKQLSEAEQLAIITAQPGDVSSADARYLQAVLASVQATLQALEASMGEGVAAYVRGVVALLDQAGLPLSSRRNAMLYRSVLAVHAASMALDPSLTPSDSAYLALQSSLPQRAQGTLIPDTKVLAAHREAWRLAKIRPNDPLKAIMLTTDPVERLRLAIATRKLPKGDLSGIVADTIAQLPIGARDAAVVCLFEADAIGRLNAAVAEQLAERYRALAVAPTFSESLHRMSTRYRTWEWIKERLSRLDPNAPADHIRANALAAAFARNELATPEDAERADEAFALTRERLRAA